MREIYRLKERLPALARRQELYTAVRASQFVIVEGQTGSGKSTQLPQYLADMPELSNGQVAFSIQVANIL
jgi:HrpA-like RNA helicase